MGDFLNFAYDLNDPDLSYLISNTQIDKELQNKNLIDSFVNDTKYDLNYGDKNSKRYYFIEDLINQYQYREIPHQQSQLRSGFIQYIFLPSDPGELVDHLKLIVLEKVGRNDNPHFNEQIISITDKLLKYECIRTHQHQKITHYFSM